MSKDNLESKVKYKLNYPHFTARNYVVAVYDNPHNVPQWDAFNFFLARFFLTKKSDLKKILGQGITERPLLVSRLKEEGKSPVFDLEKEYTVNLEEMTDRLHKGLERPVQLSFDFSGKQPYTDPKRAKIKLTDITSKELFWLVRERIKKKFGSYKPMDLDYRTFLLEGDPKHPERKSHSGTRHLTGYINSKGDGRKDNRYNKVRISGPFVKSKNPFSVLYSESKDAFYAGMKGRDKPSQLAAIEVIKLLLTARYHPEKVDNLQNVLDINKSEIMLPFHVHKSHPLSEDSSYVAKGEQPNMVNLMVDSVLAYLFNDQTKSEISKALTKIGTIFDPDYLLERLKKGAAGFEVIVNEFTFGEWKPIPEGLRKWYDNITGYYRKEGFELKRLVLEFKDSPYESIAMEYQNGNEVRRLIFGDHPPVERKMIFDEKTERDILFTERPENKPKNKHPFQKLFQPHYSKGLRPEDFDDASRRMPIFSEYRIPWFVHVPDKSMVQDWGSGIKRYLPKGFQSLRGRLFARNDYLANSPYKDERFNVSAFLGRLKA